MFLSFVQILVCSKSATDVDEQIKYACVLLFTILHELGHWSFFKFSCGLDEEKHTPCGELRWEFDFVFILVSCIQLGILMEEPWDAIETLLFGFRMQHYGASYPEFQVCIWKRLLFSAYTLLMKSDAREDSRQSF